MFGWGRFVSLSSLFTGPDMMTQWSAAVFEAASAQQLLCCGCVVCDDSAHPNFFGLLQVKQFMRDRNLPALLRSRVRQHFTRLLQHKTSFDEQVWTTMEPDAAQAQV